jgi:hypothetical protein
MSWRTVRALLLAAVIVVEAVDAIPGNLGARTLARPTAQAELDAWRRLLARVGVQTTNEALADAVVAVVKPPLRARKEILDVARPVQRLLGTGQSWAFFAYPERFPQALVLEVRRAGAWTEVHHPFAVVEPTLGRALRFRRLRGVYVDAGGRPAATDGWRAFADWVARALLATDPTIEAVRVSMERRATDRGGVERRLREERAR